MSSHHACQPPRLVGDGQMPAPLKLVFDLLELGLQPLRDGVTPEPETPASPLPADVREAQEVERLRLPQSPRRSSLGSEPPELDQPGLVGMQLQPELRQPLAKSRRNCLASARCSNPQMKSSAKRVMIMSPRACRRLHHLAHRSRT